MVGLAAYSWLARAQAESPFLYGGVLSLLYLLRLRARRAIGVVTVGLAMVFRLWRQKGATRLRVRSWYSCLFNLLLALAPSQRTAKWRVLLRSLFTLALVMLSFEAVLEDELFHQRYGCRFAMSKGL